MAPPQAKALDRQFNSRLDPHLERARAALSVLYGHRPDFEATLAGIVDSARAMHRERPAWLRKLDAKASEHPDWFLDNREVGAIAYLDRFAGTVAGLRDHIGYLESLGVTYLHLMPLLAVPPGDNDGGYAVASYRELRPDLGTMTELAALAEELASRGIRLCLDFVCNHTADTHAWALAAKAGDPEAQALYWMFPDRSGPDRYQPYLREIFPERGPTHFHWIEQAQRWVWTTFYAYQWDLNFSNPVTFRRMLEEMLFLANQGVQVLRLDAVPFLWKRAGTNCENQPEAHLLIQAFNAFARMAAPALVFKSEAIVHPDEVIRYVGAREAQLSYHPLLMVLLWEALATRDATLLRTSFAKRYPLPPDCGWVNYIRCHDDIGWGFADEDALAVGIDPDGHRRFLNAFYFGRFRHFDGAADFAVGLPFGENPRTGDVRVAGMAASLAGLERALAAGKPRLVDLAIGRLLLLHGIIFLIGGLPLIYLGDELATTNDYSYRDDPTTAGDSRWVHRPRRDWAAAEAALADPHSPAHRVHAGIRRLAAIRIGSSAFAGLDTEVLALANKHVFGFRRVGGGDTAVVLANLTEQPQPVEDRRLSVILGRGPWHDALTQASLAGDPLALAPYQLAVLIPSSRRRRR